MSLIILSWACGNDEVKPDEFGTFQVFFDNKVGADEITLREEGSTEYDYETAGGARFNLSGLGYYVSKVTLEGPDGEYYQDEMSGPSNYIWLGSMRARLQGFVIFDYAERYTDARKKISQWIDNGSLKLPEFVCDGDIEDFPSAFKKLFEGKNFGKMLLKLPAAK